MGVRLVDETHAGPAGVAQDRGLGPLGGQGPGQQSVGADRLPQGPGVVAQLAHLGRGLVHEAQHVSRAPDRTGAEQGVAAPGAEPDAHLGLVEVEAVVAHEQVEAGRVAASDLEAVEGEEGNLHGGERRQRRPSRPWAGQALHPTRRLQPVPLNGPEGVLDGHHARV